jgi:hypothetical protein
VRLGSGLVSRKSWNVSRLEALSTGFVPLRLARGTLNASLVVSFLHPSSARLRVKLRDPEEKVREMACRILGQLDYETTLHHIDRETLETLALRFGDKRVRPSFPLFSLFFYLPSLLAVSPLARPPRTDNPLPLSPIGLKALGMCSCYPQYGEALQSGCF